MDPNATLAEMRRLAAAILADDTNDATKAILADELAEHVQTLDQWIGAGGFLPDSWSGWTVPNPQK
jgi:hypothetical protein